MEGKIYHSATADYGDYLLGSYLVLLLWWQLVSLRNR